VFVSPQNRVALSVSCQPLSSPSRGSTQPRRWQTATVLSDGARLRLGCGPVTDFKNAIWAGVALGIPGRFRRAMANRLSADTLT